MRLELEGVGRLVEGDPRPERPERDVERARRLADVLLDEEEAARRRLGRQQGEVVLAEDLRAHEAEQEAELAGRDPAIGEGHRRLAEAAARRHDLVEELLLERADQRRERRDVGVDPAGPVDDAGSLDDPGQLGPERLRQARHDPGHRRGVVGLRGAGARPAVRRARRRPQAIGRRSAPPAAQSTRPAPRDDLRAPAEDRRRRAERRADEEPRLPEPVVAPGRAAAAGPPAASALAHEATGRELDRLDVEERLAEQPRRHRPEAVDVARRQLDVDGPVAAASAGASRPLIASSSDSAAAVAVAESTIATPSPATAAMIGRSSG